MWLIIHKQRGGKLSKFSKITHWRLIVYDDHMADNCLHPAWSAKSKVLLFANANVTSVFRPRGLALICSLPISQWVPATWKLKIGRMTFWRQSKYSLSSFQAYVMLEGTHLLYIIVFCHHTSIFFSWVLLRDSQRMSRWWSICEMSCDDLTQLHIKVLYATAK